METQKKPARSRKRRSKTSEFVQDFLPVREIRNGIIETTDDRYVKIIEILPINFLLRSSEEQYNIISSFASWLKISPMKLQFKGLLRYKAGFKIRKAARVDKFHAGRCIYYFKIWI